MSDLYKEDLEKAVQMVLDRGLSTGHAGTFPELMGEVLETVRELERKVADQEGKIEALTWGGAEDD